MGHRGARHRRRISWVPRLGELGVFPLALGLIFFPMAQVEDLPAPIHLEVGDSVRLMPPGSTLGQLQARYSLRPKRGALLDVEGEPLLRGRFPGSVFVNGQIAARSTVLEDGDRVLILDGEDRVEGTKRERTVVGPGQVPNPQSFLGSIPGEQIVVSGRRSGKIVSVTFRPTGASKQPREVALTFDDGPHPVHTPRILAVLKRFNVKATFFVLGSLAARYPKLIQRELREGMTVANHSMNHPFRPPFRSLPERVTLAEIRQATRVLEEAGVQPSLFRPPGGSWSPRVLEQARSEDQRLVLWSVDSRDWTGLSAGSIAAIVLRDAGPGAIVLLHDGGGDRSATVAALPEIIKGLRKRNLRPVAM